MSNKLHWMLLKIFDLNMKLSCLEVKLILEHKHKTFKFKVVDLISNVMHWMFMFIYGRILNTI